MQKKNKLLTNINPLELIMGLMILTTAIGFAIYWFYSVSNFTSFTNNDYYVEFSDVSGLIVDNEVKVGGLKVGKVTDISIGENLVIKVKLSIRDDIAFPIDSEVIILNSGLSGGKFIDIIPGVEAEKLEDDGLFVKSKDVQSIEDIISRALFLVQEQINIDN